MSSKSEWVRFGSQGEYSGLLVSPERAEAPLPGVVVIQEAWGVDQHIEDVTRRIAMAGYAALAPDVFAKNGERPPALTPERLVETVGVLNSLSGAVRRDPKAREAALAALPSELGGRITETFGTLFAGGFLPPVVAAASFLRREHPASRGQRIGAVGFCMGGGLSALLACNDPELAGAIIFYGRAPPLEEVAKIRCPVLGFYGSFDQPLIEGLPAFTGAMTKNGKRFECVIYPGADHAFFNDTRPAYDVRASRDAFVKTLEFFRKNLSD